MAYQIRFNSDATSVAVNKYDTIKERLENIYARMTNVENELDHAWDGAASEEAVREIREISNAVKGCAHAASQGMIALKSAMQMFSSVSIIGGTVAYGEDLASRFITVGARLRIPEIRFRSNKEIRINPQQVIALAHSYRTAAEEVEDIAQFHRSLLDGLQESWEGNAYQQFLDSFQNLDRMLMQIHDAAIGLSKEMVTIAERYQAIDNERSRYQ